MADGRKKLVPIIFMIVWLIFWAAMMLVVCYTLIGTLRAGQTGGAAFSAIWLVAAGFGLYKGARTLRRLMVGEARTWTDPRKREWKDGLAPPPAPPAAPVGKDSDGMDRAGD